MSRDNYIYVSSKIRSLEKHLLSEADMTRVIDAKTPDIAFKAFNSLDYAGELLDLEAKDYRVAMDRKMSRLKKVFEQTIPEPKLTRLLFLERDFYNIKILFKEKVSGENYEDYLETAPGLIPVDQLRRYVVEDLGAEIDEKVKIDIDELKKEIGDDSDAERVENLVDQKLNHIQHMIAEKIGNEFIIDLYKYLADKNNINLLLRAKKLEKSAVWVKDRMNAYGRISTSILLSHVEMPDETEFVTSLKNYFPPMIEEHLEEYLKDRQIWRLERGINNVIIDHLKKAKLIGYGPEVVVAYYFGKKYAIKNLSTIMALKFGEIDPSEIRKHLVDTY
jgi:V/A-type H+/Na+-transporting ATPase subunit C